MDWTAWDAKVLEAEASLRELWDMSKTLPEQTPDHVTRKMVQDEINRAEFGLENAGVGASFFRE
jgi:hypothetical protein